RAVRAGPLGRGREAGADGGDEEVDPPGDRADRVRVDAVAPRRNARVLRRDRYRRARAHADGRSRNPPGNHPAPGRRETAKEMTHMATSDEEKIWELHRGFVQANRTGEVPFLRKHMRPGADTLVWYNLHHSNYIGVDHIE